MRIVKRMVLKILPGGEVQHMLRDTMFKPPLRGTREIKRVSEVLFDPRKQKFYIKFLVEPLTTTWPSGVYTEEGAPVFFDSYEDAVDKEISVIQQEKIQGASLWG